MDTVWDGITRSETLHEDAARIRHALADAAKRDDWPCVFEILSEREDLVNTTRPGGSSFDAPLHQAAHGGAAVEVVQRLVGLGGWRTLQNACGERPIDIAARQGHRHLFGVLTPEFKQQVPLGILLKVQSHFHGVIRGRVESLVKEHALRLPELEPLLEVDSPQFWFTVPGMYGGFGYRLEATGVEAKLMSESWCRVAEGSGQRHEITSSGSQLIAEGFV
jgi:hypothetical protein